ncbi:MAG: D-alanyl-D-alanine carboxypeptidase family protein, partial [Clostridia bacterium]|nr:D-alanyl-D-alanine carboxypeptidase family protein [Clostridia bacterium]
MDKYLMIVNNQKRFFRDMVDGFTVREIAAVAPEGVRDDWPIYLETETAKALEKLNARLAEKNIRIAVSSGLRTIKQQKDVCEQILVKKREQFMKAGATKADASIMAKEYVEKYVAR